MAQRVTDAAGADPTPTVTAPALTTPSVPDAAHGQPADDGRQRRVDQYRLRIHRQAAATRSRRQSIIIILLLTVLAIAPALLVMLTSFTRIVIVLSLTRNALGLPSIPPNQVVIGLALFLSLFVMAPTLSKINDVALQPLLDGKIDFSQAYDRAQVPLHDVHAGSDPPRRAEPVHQRVGRQGPDVTRQDSARRR